MGDEYSIADIALLGWVRNLVEYYEAAQLVAYDEVDDVPFWLDRGLARPAVQRGLRFRRTAKTQAKLKLIERRSPRAVPGSTSWRNQLSHISSRPERGSTLMKGCSS